jgi:succinoglycan biosynthesis transport protein ExoP
MFDLPAAFSNQIKPRAAYYLPVVPVAVVIGALLFVYQIHRVPAIYSSEAKIVVSGKINLPETANAYREELANFLGTQIAILSSGELASRATQKIHLEHPELTGSASVQAHPVTGTTIIVADAIGSNPAYVTNFLRATLDQFTEFRKDRRIETTDAALRQIREEIPRTERQLAADEEALFKFKQEHNMGYWDREAADAGQLLSQLKSRETNLRMQLQMATALQDQAVTQTGEGRLLELSTLDGTRKQLPADPDSAQSPEIDALRTQQIKLEVERDQLLRTLQPKHPRVQHLDEEIQAQSRLIQQLMVEKARSFSQMVAGMRIELGVVTRAISDCEQQALKSAQAAAEYERLQANVTLSRDVHARLAGGLQNVDVSREVDLDMVQTLQQPTEASAIPKSYARTAFQGVFYGLFFGFMIFRGLQKVDQRAFSAEEIAEAADSTISSEIPYIPEFSDPGYHPVESGQPPLMMEAMGTLVSSLKLSSEGGLDQKVMLCTSATPDEGKSTVALHLALYLQKSGLKTLLIDADLRRGCLGETLSLDPAEMGMADLIESRLNQWRPGVHQLESTGLSILPRGQPRANTVDLLPRWLTREFFAELRASYDAIVIDSSPLVPVADSVHFLSHADHVLVVGRIKFTRLTFLKKTVGKIRNHSRKKLHLIVNGVKDDKRVYGYGYGRDNWPAVPVVVDEHRKPAA